MKTLSVDLGDRSYPIYIGADLLRQPELIGPHIHSKQVLLLTNETVAPLYLDPVRAALGNERIVE